MFHYTGHYFCTKSNWDNSFYDARNLVSIMESDYHDDKFSSEDFDNLLNKKDFFNEDEYKRIKEEFGHDWEDKFIKRMCQTTTNFLKSEVMAWLNENIKDNPKEKIKGWCVGNDNYNSHNGISFSLFFYRRKDALNFIRTWSVYKKPTGSYNQDTYISRKLNLKTMTLQVEKKE